MPDPTEIERLIDPDCRDEKCGSCVGGPCEHSCHVIEAERAQRDEVRARLEEAERRILPDRQQLAAVGSRDLRARIIHAIGSWQHESLEASADAVLAELLKDPGNLPARMADAMREGLRQWAAMGIEDTRGVTKWDFLATCALSVRWEHAAHLAARVGDAEHRADVAEGEHQVTQDRLADAATVNRGLRPALESAEAEAGRLRIHLKAQRQEAWLHKTRADEADTAITALRDLRETLATSAKRLTRREITRQLDAALDAPALRALDSKEILSSSAEAERDALNARIRATCSAARIAREVGDHRKVVLLSDVERLLTVPELPPLSPPDGGG